MTNDRHILEEALAHYQAATAEKPTAAGGRWDYWAGKMREKIGTFSTTKEVLQFAQLAQNVPFSHRDKRSQSFLGSCLKMTVLEFPQFAGKIIWMSDNPDSRPETIPPLLTKDLLKAGWTTDSDEMNIPKSFCWSDMFFWHIWSLFTCQAYISDVRSVLEIGGGDGSFARLWCLYFPVDRYVIVDLPESLYFSEVCLRAVFGDEVGYAIDDIPQTKIVLVPINKLGLYKAHSDLVVSIGSMQEMDDVEINRYMEWLDNYDVDCFYSLNYAGHGYAHMFEGRCWWGPRPSNQWMTKLMKLDPTMIHSMCEGRNFLQAIYHRKQCTGTLIQWSVYRGQLLTLDVFLEGLDLLRQDPTNGNIEAFMEVVLENKGPIGNEIIPKEVIGVSQFLREGKLKEELKRRVHGAEIVMNR